MIRGILLFVTALLLGASLAAAQTWAPPADAARCPSKWGAGDERGSMNLMTPARVLSATRLIRTGEVIELGQTLDPTTMPFFPGRQLSVLTKRTNVLPQSNRRISNEEMVIGELGQIGTQFDGFSHQGIGNGFYNCFTLDQTATRTGFTKLGIEKVGAIVTRGVLLDVAALKGVAVLPDSYEITVKDLEDALARQSLTLQSGDAIIINTGWGTLWGKDNARYIKTDPGIGVAAATWLATKSPILVGSDNWSVEVNPNPDQAIGSPVHQILLAVNGIHMLESLKLEELAAKRAYEFAFVLQPLKLKGATGSTVAPIAIR
jgi:kynurenine formamidase